MLPQVPAARPGKSINRRLAWLLPGPLLIALYLFAPASWIDRVYATHIYPLVHAFMGWTSSLAFPLAPALLVLLAAAVLLGLLWALVSACTRRSMRPLGAYGYAIVVSAGLLAACFIAFWGLNYRRTPIETHLDMRVDAREPEALEALCQELIAKANSLEAQSALPSTDAILSAVPAAFEAAHASWELWPSDAPIRAKASGVNRLLSNLMIEGIYIPFTFEALINTAIPTADLPFTACHEVAHSLGYAREEEANFIAFLVCSAAPEPYFQYSGVMGALRYAMPALGEADAGAFWRCFDQLSDAVRADMATRDAYWLAMLQSPVAVASQHINDGYLSLATQQSHGGQSYGRVVDLLLALNEQ